MPSIGVRVGPLKAPFSPQQGTLGEGLAAGLGHARRIERDNIETERAENQLEREEEAAVRDRGAHDYFNLQFGELEEDPAAREAFDRLPMEVKEHEIGRRRELAELETRSRMLQRNLDSLRNDPRGQALMEQLEPALENPAAIDMDAVEKTVAQAIDDIAEIRTIEFEAQRTLEDTMTFVQTTPTDQLNPKLITAMQQLEQALSAQQRDPNFPPMSRRELMELRDGINMAKVPFDTLERYDAAQYSAWAEDMTHAVSQSMRETRTVQQQSAKPKGGSETDLGTYEGQGAPAQDGTTRVAHDTSDPGPGQADASTGKRVYEKATDIRDRWSDERLAKALNELRDAKSAADMFKKAKALGIDVNTPEGRAALIDLLEEEADTQERKPGEGQAAGARAWGGYGQKAPGE